VGVSVRVGAAVGKGVEVGGRVGVLAGGWVKAGGRVMVEMRAAVSDANGRMVEVGVGEAGSVVKVGGMAVWVDVGVFIASDMGGGLTGRETRSLSAMDQPAKTRRASPHRPMMMRRRRLSWRRFMDGGAWGELSVWVVCTL
jgi:hypothetical protein